MSKTSKKYVATILKRNELGENYSFASCDHVAIGEIDKETQIFTDENGNCFGPMSNPWIISSNVDYMYDNVIAYDEIRGIAKDSKIPVDIVIKEYEEINKKMVYLLGKTESGESFCTTINMEDIKKAAKDRLPVGVKQSADIAEDDIDDSLDVLASEIVSGKYSLEELLEILDNLKETHKDLGMVIDITKEQIKEQQAGIKTNSKENIQKAAEETEKITETKEENEEDKPVIINIDELFKNVTKTLIAQDEPALRVITELARKEMDARKKKEGILLTGSTGVGKTELMRLIANYTNLDFHRIDSTQLTVPGYVGKDIEEELWDLYKDCGYDLKRAERAIVFFDEIDKKGSSNRSDVNGRGVLNTLLRFIEGETYRACQDTRTSKKFVDIKTDNMTVILGGAFTEVYGKPKEKSNLGFLGNSEEKPKEVKVTTKDFVERGQIPQEFMGRVTIIKMNDLSVNDLKRILLESDQSSSKIQEDIFKKLGVKITFTDDYLTGVAQTAIAQETGARGLNDVINDSTWKAFHEVQSHPGKYKEVIIDKEALEDSDNYQLVKKRKKRND